MSNVRTGESEPYFKVESVTVSQMGWGEPIGHAVVVAILASGLYVSCAPSDDPPCLTGDCVSDDSECYPEPNCVVSDKSGMAPSHTKLLLVRTVSSLTPCDGATNTPPPPSSAI
jgi:hypothetical protein